MCVGACAFVIRSVRVRACLTDVCVHGVRLVCVLVCELCVWYLCVGGGGVCVCVVPVCWCWCWWWCVCVW